MTFGVNDILQEEEGSCRVPNLDTWLFVTFFSTLNLIFFFESKVEQEIWVWKSEGIRVGGEGDSQPTQ
jgi:hypothetical protein